MNLDNELAKQYILLAQQMRATYKLGRYEKIKLLLNQEHFQYVQRLLVYHQYIHKARQDQIERSRATLNEINKNHVAIEKENKQLQALVSQKRTTVQLLSDKRSQRLSILSDLNQQIKTKDQKLQELTNNKQALEKLIKNIKLSKNVITTSKQSLGKMKGQLKMPLAGKIITNFGSYFDNLRIKSNGLLIAANPNQQVRSIFQGKVTFADWLQGYGLLIIIDHGNGYMSLYAHNEKLHKKVGDTVNTRELVAIAGQSGGMDKPGLYFEIRRNGKALNPTKMV